MTKRVLIQSNGAYSADWLKVFELEPFPEAGLEPERTLIYEGAWHDLNPMNLHVMLDALGLDVEHDDEVKFSNDD